MNKKIVIANWKMNGSSNLAISLAKSISTAGQDADKNCDIVLCPPYIYLAQVATCLDGSNISLGAQDLYPGSQGAVTGAIDSSMLVDISCSYVIVGHSERRGLFKETNQIVAMKFFSAASAGLIPILCVGETKEQREQGVTLEIIKEQISAITNDKHYKLPTKFIVAYEPIWAIGTGEIATAELASSVHSYIASLVPNGIAIIYGGSVKANNSEELIAQDHIDGFLVGGASLHQDEFIKICC